MDILLVHGAWHGAWCWAPLEAALAARGIRSVAIDLPGHGEKRRPPWLTSWRGYIDAVGDAAASFDRPPLVVGHSMGGGVITGAAERRPERFAALVYLAAFLPLDGENILELSQRQPPAPGARLRPLRGDVHFEPAAAAEAFFHDCPDAEAWAARLQPQAVRPVRTPVHVTPEQFGTVPRYYIRCLEDRALSPAFQLAMIERMPMRRTYEMKTGHSPFLAKPEELAAILADISLAIRDGAAT